MWVGNTIWCSSALRLPSLLSCGCFFRRYVNTPLLVRKTPLTETIQTRQRSLEDIGVLFGDSEESLKPADANEIQEKEEVSKSET